MPTWKPWLHHNPIIAKFISGATRGDAEAYFIRIHAVTEYMLRRVLLVGLRKNLVIYSDALAWVNNNDVTPDRIRYPALFDRLFGAQMSFAKLTEASPLLDLWDLWLDFTKIVRNHISHGIRKYDEPWLQCAVHIDQAFIVQLCLALDPYVGGSLGGDMRKLHPRLPKGKVDIDIPALVGAKAKKPRPIASLQAAATRLAALNLN